MVCVLPGEMKVSRAEKLETVSRDEVDDSGAENTMVAPPRGTLLQPVAGARWDFRWGREEDQDVPAGWEEEVEGSGGCRALLYMEARRASQELERS